MKKSILIILMCVLSLILNSQNKVLHAGEKDWYEGPVLVESNLKTLQPLQPLACPSNSTLSSGYPLWTNYWAGYMIKINNITTCSITINCFEARFQGTSGYRIYTKTGTFVGFETTAGAWILVGTAANLTGLSTVAPTPIPIAVNVTIPPGASQSFYLTRTDNVIANRHLYITGVGTAGTTVYAADANIQITEGSYIDPFFAFLNIGTRRPSLDVYYNTVCVLPIELVKFDGKYYDKANNLSWITALEINNDYFVVERSEDGLNWLEVGKIDGSGTSQQLKNYSFKDKNFSNTVNYYRLTQVDYNGESTKSNIIVIDNRIDSPIIIRTTNLIGQDVTEEYKGLKFLYYSNGVIKKEFNN